MKKRERKISPAAAIYDREAKLAEKCKKIQADDSLSKNELLKEFIELNNEYTKLLKQAIKITRVGDSNQKKLFLANEQIEKQKEELNIAYKKMEHLARTDPLTELSNRRGFLEEFQHEINRFERSKKPFSIVLGDIDDFKLVNDRYGHDCGDFVLVNTAKIIKSLLRKQDTVGRWGGEEFIMLLPEAPLQGGKVVAEAIRKRIAAETFSYKDYQLSITITLGVCEFKESMDIDSCVKQADSALYSGKFNGKNSVILANE